MGNSNTKRKQHAGENTKIHRKSTDAKRKPEGIQKTQKNEFLFNRTSRTTVRHRRNILQIVTPNTDNFSTEHTPKWHNATTPRRPNTYIGYTRDTHTHTLAYVKNGYRIYTPAAIRVGTDKKTDQWIHQGVEILIHQDIAPFGNTIDRIDHRVTTLTPPTKQDHNTANSNCNLCAAQSISNKRRTNTLEQLGKTLDEISKRHLAIWRTDANGQLGKISQDKEHM